MPSAASNASPTSSAQGVSWRLDDLYQSIDDPKIERDLALALSQGRAFEKTCRGKVAALPSKDAQALREAIALLEELYELMDMPAVHASLVHAARTDDPRHGALLSRT